MSDVITISIADSQYLTRRGLKQVLSQRQGIRVVGEISTEPDLLAHLRTTQPDIVILDYNQPRHFNPETIAKVRASSPRTEVLVISADDQKDRIFNVIQGGIKCFITKECDEAEILDAIHAAKTGQKFFCNKVLDFILEKSLTPASDNTESSPLTPREQEIVILTAQGLIAKEIAAKLNLSTHTVYTHKKRIMKKLELKSPMQLVMYAIENGMIDVNGDG